VNCRHAQDELLAARDAPSGAASSSALNEHLSGCADCQALQQQLAAATSAWQETEAQVTIPDAQLEWHAVRRRLRQSESAGPATAWWRRTLRYTAPLTAAAAVAFVIWTGRQDPATAPLVTPETTAEIAQTEDPWAEFADHFAYAANVEYVETENDEASPFVYVDDESGWLIVWASAPPDEASI
jgi:hypothetical protein